MSNLLNTDALEELINQVGPELVHSLLAELKTDATERVVRMQDLLANDAFEDLRKEAHTLKSSCGTMGLKDVSQEAARIESLLLNQQSDEAAPIVPGLIDLLERSLSQAEQWLADK